MVAQGADLDFLASVTIYRVQDDELNSYCRPGAAAVTWYNTIYYCNLDIKYFDPSKPTPVLLHELIHVAQFQNYEGEILDELAWISVLKTRDKAIEIWNNQSQFVQNHDVLTIDIGKFDPYTYSWVEVQGKQCQLAFAANPNIPLDRAPCNMAP